MDDSSRRLERPFWVQVALWGLPNRVSVWVCFWLSILLTVASILYGFRDFRFFAGGMFIFAALWYYLAIRWVDQHDRWPEEPLLLSLVTNLLQDHLILQGRIARVAR